LDIGYGKILTVAQVSYFECARDGKKLRSDRDAVDLIGEALGVGAELIVIPVERLHDDFFRLRTGVAGQMLQKFMTYGKRVAILGDISHHVETSAAFRDLVFESNRGEDIWFAEDMEEVERRLGPPGHSVETRRAVE
jgi:uncharacterized protein DUF4180